MTASSRTVAVFAIVAAACAAYLAMPRQDAPATPPALPAAASGPGTAAARPVSDSALPPARSYQEPSQGLPEARIPAIRLQLLGIVRLGDGRVSLTLTDGIMTATLATGEQFGDLRLDATDAETATFTHLPSGRAFVRRLDDLVATGDRVVAPGENLAAAVPAGPFPPDRASAASASATPDDPALKAMGISTPPPLNAPPPQREGAPRNLPPPQGVGDHVPPSNVPPPQGWHPVVPQGGAPEPGSPAEGVPPKPN